MSDTVNRLRRMANGLVVATPIATLREAADEIERLTLAQGSAWAEAECDRLVSNLNSVCEERDAMRTVVEAVKALQLRTVRCTDDGGEETNTLLALDDAQWDEVENALAALGKAKT